MFQKLFNPDNALMITMTQVTDCIFLSLFWILGCFPVVTVGASSAALYDAVYHGFRKGDKHCWSRFLRSFRQNLKAGIAPSVVYLALFAAFGWGLIRIWNAVAWEQVSTMVFSVAALPGLLVLGILSVMFPLLSRFENSFGALLKNTLLLFTIIPICLIIGLLLALLMDQGLKCTGLFRTLILLPFALSYVVTGTVWAWMYNPSYGIINSILKMFNVSTTSLLWLSSQKTVMISIIIALVWQFSGYVALIFFAGIRSVPQNVINAAKLDGAYTPRIYLKLVLPALKGSMSSAVTILAMYALRSFDFIWQLTQGGPGYSSHTLPVMMYRETFEQNNFAYGAAIANFLLVLVLVLILPITYFSNRKKA